MTKVGEGRTGGMKTVESDRARFFRLTLLNVASNLTVPIASLVDTAMLGHLDEVRFLAGVALASVIFDYLFWGFGFLRMGTTGMVAQAHAEGEVAESTRVLLRSAGVAVLLGGATLVFALPLREVSFWLLSGSDATESVGRLYFGARIWGAPAVLLNLAVSGFFIGTGRSAQALAMAIAQNVEHRVSNVLG
ncbi:MAG: MATE family efflux transporter, partial [Myxococcota bacterium]